jgi:hypothetical protein
MNIAKGRGPAVYFSISLGTNREGICATNIEEKKKEF